FDVSRWGFIVARANGRRIGGAVIAFDTESIDLLERRRDLAVLWDIRIDSTFRGHDVGTALFRAAERWAADRNCSQIKVETQNINLAACRFYARQGCTLGAVNRFAYPDLPHEIQMIWYKDLV
ncbi:MAG: GNAT family N-acetyltransferase, partial [Cyanobacteria bacterium]|nr:GNAT family N-acetyltransferase [Cyanobacteriota bacterium]